MAYRKHDKKIKKDAFIGTKTVKTLKEDMFESYLSDQDVALVMFYDPKSAASQLSKPHFVKAAMTIKKPNVVFAAVNCIDQRNLCLAEEIRDLPTIKLYARGRFLKKQNPMKDYQHMVKAVEELPALPPKPTSKTVYVR